MNLQMRDPGNVLISVWFGLFCLSLIITSTGQARPTFGRHAVIVSASDLASQAGIEIMKSGGNVVDAAVATEFVLAVTRPYYASLGGGGFLLLRLNGKVTALDFREKAAAKSSREMFLNAAADASTVGGLAVGIPGNVMGFYELHKKYGKKTWREDLEPALKLAQKGFVLTEEFVRFVNENQKIISGSGKSIFPATLKIGDKIVQHKVAAALKIIQARGAKGFYEGEIAKDIVDSTDKQKGILTLADLKNYQARWLEPLKSHVLGVDVFTMPPPSSGGALLLSELKQSEKIELQKTPAYSTQEYFLMAEIMRRAFFDRQYIADPGFSKLNIEQIFSDERVAKWSKSIDRKKKSEIKKAEFEIHEGENTTHFDVSDSDGNAVTATVTVNTEFGSGIFTDKFGINLNNQMDDFTTNPGKANVFGLVQSELNTVAPGKTPLSSMTPTIVEKNSQLYMALGAPGGPRIINAVYQGLYHALETDFTLEEIMQAPRVHHQWNPDKITHDKTLSPTISEGLISKGFELEAGATARLYMIRLNEKTHVLEGAFDYRGEGGAASY